MVSHDEYAPKEGNARGRSDGKQTRRERNYAKYTSRKSVVAAAE